MTSFDNSSTFCRTPSSCDSTDFWGCNLQGAVHELKKQIRSSGFKIKRGKRPGVIESISAVQALIPALVSYAAGQGKYHPGNRLVFHHELPLVGLDTSTEWWPIMVVSLNPDKQLQYTKFDDGFDTEDEDCGFATRDQEEGDRKNDGHFDQLIKDGDKKQEASGSKGDAEVEDVTDMFQKKLAFEKRKRVWCWVICGYQWLDEIPDAWPCRLRSRM